MDLRSFSFTLFVPFLPPLSPLRSATICFLLSTSDRTFVFGIACTMSHEFGSAKPYHVCVYVRRNWLRTACPDDLFIIAFRTRKKTWDEFHTLYRRFTKPLYLTLFYSFYFIPSYFASFGQTLIIITVLSSSRGQADLNIFLCCILT